MNRAVALVSAIPWVVAVPLLVIGLAVAASAESGDFVSAYFATGDFVAAVFGAGQFVAGAFAAGLFGAGFAAAGVFAAGAYATGIFAFGGYAVGVFAVGGKRHRRIRDRAEGDRSLRQGQKRGFDTGPLAALTNSRPPRTGADSACSGSRGRRGTVPWWKPPRHHMQRPVSGLNSSVIMDPPRP